MFSLQDSPSQSHALTPFVVVVVVVVVVVARLTLAIPCFDSFYALGEWLTPPRPEFDVSHSRPFRPTTNLQDLNAVTSDGRGNKRDDNDDNVQNLMSVTAAPVDRLCISRISMPVKNIVCGWFLGGFWVVFLLELFV